MAKKTILKLPEEILESIFDYLDFGSKKNFSLCCSAFNTIFSDPKNLQKVNFNGEEAEKSLNFNITRQYKNIWACGKPMSLEMWSKFTKLRSFSNEKKVKCYHMNCCHDWVDKNYHENSVCLDRPEPFYSITSDYLIGILPHLSHLSCLNLHDIRSTLVLEREKYQKEFKKVELNDLRILKIDVNLFTTLNARFIKFSTIKLEILELFEHYTSIDERRLEVCNIGALKSLITAQKKLQKLDIRINYYTNIMQLFDTPLVIPSHLKYFILKIQYGNFFEFHTDRQDNFCDFICAQKSLEILKFNFLCRDKTEKMQRLLNARLDMPLVYRFLIVYLDSGDILDPTGRVDDQNYIIEELLKSEKSPNLTTKYLRLHYMHLHGRMQQLSRIVHLITLKFPNLKALNMIYDTLFFDVGGTQKLDELKHLESLKLNVKTLKDNIPPLAIKNLKKLKIRIFGGFRDNSWSTIELKNLTILLQRHELVEELAVEIFQNFRNQYSEDKMYLIDEDFQKFLKNALIDLRCLKKFNFSVRFGSDTDRWTAVTSEIATETIAEHAKCGFVLETECIKLMKRFDGSVAAIA